MSGTLAQLARVEALLKFKKKQQEKKEARRILRDLQGARERCLASTFGPQRDLVLSSALKIVNFSGRRAGKTDGWAAKLYLNGTKPGAENGLSAFVTSSLARSERLIGKAFQAFNSRHRLGITRHQRDGEVYYRFPNGHSVWLVGVKDRGEIDKLRGPKYFGAVVDECQGITQFLEPLILESIEPALMDHNGFLGLSGTPNVQPVGDWHKFCTEGKFTSFHWDCRQNPYLEQSLIASGVLGGVEEYLRTLRETYGWDENTPKYVREYLGLWCADRTSLCYPFSREKNWVEYLPFHEGWQFGIGVDFGVNEPCAWVVVAYRYDCPTIYIIHCEEGDNLSPSEAALKTIELKKRFNASTVVADRGGIGAAFLKEWITRFNLPAIPAKKVDAAGQIALMAGELASGAIVLVGENPLSLAEEWEILPWNDDMTGHHDGYRDHKSDAARYIIRHINPGEAPDIDDAAPAPKDPEFDEFLERQAAIARAANG